MISKSNHFRASNKLRLTVVVVLMFAIIASKCETENTSFTQLSENFVEPSSENNLYTWWHWINGNITKEGITTDLEWMQKVGIKGAIIFSVGTMNDDLPRKVKFRTDEWWEMVAHAEKEADRLNLELGIHNCDGWSHSGGPWISPEESMKQLTTSEMIVKGGAGKIVVPEPKSKLDFYRDVAILAYPLNENIQELKIENLISNSPGFTPDVFLDNDAGNGLKILATEDKPIHFTSRFEESRKIASVSLQTSEERIRDFILEIQVSNDGENFTSIKSFKSYSKGILGWKTVAKGATMTFSFPQTECKYLRLLFTESSRFVLSGIKLFTENKIDLWEAKAAQIQYTEHGGGDEFYVPNHENWNEEFSTSTINKNEIINLTQKINGRNELDWQPKSGTWKIIRVGYTTTGKTNGPSTVEGRGLEADKLNATLMKKHYDIHMGEVVSRAKEAGVNSMNYTEIDSWENGVQNWTEGFQDIFMEQCGYDLIPFLPLLNTGQIVESYEVSERFLWDYRRTLANLIATECFGNLADLARKDGLQVFAEGSGRQQFLYDPINYNQSADIPKGEFWTRWEEDGANLTGNPEPYRTMRPRVDCKVASSVAHVYGKQLAGSESFTGGAAQTLEQGPYEIKMLTDKAFAMGINYMVLHTSVHQPYSNLEPGFGLMGAGSYFTRKNILYENCQPWMNYMARCQYLLRQGTFVADVCCFTGDNVPNYLGFRDELSVPLSEGYDYDGVNSDIILNHMSVEDGNIVLKSGMKYRFLLLPNNEAMNLSVLNKIENLVKIGAVVIGPKPKRIHGLSNSSIADLEVKKIADRLWAKVDGETVKENSYGKGKVIWGKSFEEIFDEENLIADFSYIPKADTIDFNYIHRTIDDVEIYFVANGRYFEKDMVATFRVENKVPYLFYPDNGKVVKAGQYKIADGKISIPLHFDPAGSVFVVFKKESKQQHVISNVDENVDISYSGDEKLVGEFTNSGTYQFALSDGNTKQLDVNVPKPIIVQNNWNIKFPQPNKEIEQVQNVALFKWNESENPAIKYFSGTAIYSNTFEVPATYLNDAIKLNLNLGQLKYLVNVKINGKDCAELWKVPFNADITELVKPGKNTITVHITNTIANRLIGDEQLPQDIKYVGGALKEFPDWWENQPYVRSSGRSTFTSRKFYNENSKLTDSGLWGPVEIRCSVIKKI